MAWQLVGTLLLPPLGPSRLKPVPHVCLPAEAAGPGLTKTSSEFHLDSSDKACSSELHGQVTWVKCHAIWVKAVTLL